MLKVLKILIAASCLTLSLAFAFKEIPPLAKVESKVNVVVIDAGHGGHDIGTRGRKAREATVALRIALALGKKIKQDSPEVKVLYTRDSDEFIELAERSAFANRNNADLFISIHCNSTPNSHSVR